MAKLFEGMKIKNMEVRNRIVMPPMCMYSAGEDGLALDWHRIHYATRAIGGVGLIILEATGVENRGRITDRDLGLWDDAQIEGLADIVGLCKEYGSKVAIQLAHAGRKSEVSSEPSIAPSPIPFNDNYRTPQEMTKEDILMVEDAFQAAAKRADIAGFDAIELHAAHGYLINEFLSPLTNKRTDEYGGSIRNRARFLIEILTKIKRVWPKEKPILVRVSAEEYLPEGNHPEDLIEILNQIKSEGVDLVHVSSGGVVEAGIKPYPGYQVLFAEMIRKFTLLPVIAGGLIASPELAEEIVQNERADFVFMGRELLRNPYWPLQAAKELREEIPWPAPYVRAR